MIRLLINLFFFAFFFIPDQYKTQKICNSIISDDPFSIIYIPDRYKTQQLSNKAVDNCLTALKFVPNWFVTSKMIKILFTAVYSEKNIRYVNEDSSNVAFICNEMGALNIELKNINLDDADYDEDDRDAIILITFGLTFGLA